MLSVVVLAAGKGTRMKSDLLKVAHPIGGRPMICHVLDTLRGLSPAPDHFYVIYGYQGEHLKMLLSGYQGLTFAEQAEQRGTGHAVMQAAPYLQKLQGETFVICGDTPLMTGASLQKLLTHHKATGAVASMLTTMFDDATGYGRVVRQVDGSVQAVVEHRDATPEQLQIKEINTGFFVFDTQQLCQALAVITPHNAQQEYYLPDVLAVFTKRGLRVEAVITPDPAEAMGINTPEQLAEAERIFTLRVKKLSR